MTSKKINLKRLKSSESIELDVSIRKKRKTQANELNDWNIENDDIIRKNYEKRLKDDFFSVDCLQLSEKLIGTYLVRRIQTSGKSCSHQLLVGRIVECEAYPGGNDQASHSYNDKKTDRIKAMYMKHGTAYVYNIYGVYCCMNISSREEGAAVLIRALEPIAGINTMKSLRSVSSKQTNEQMNKQMNFKNLTSGPSKLCQAMMITKSEFDQIDLTQSSDLWLQNELLSSTQTNSTFSNSKTNEIVKCKRIGIDNKGEEAINKPYRFYEKNNSFVSIKAPEEKVRK